MRCFKSGVQSGAAIAKEDKVWGLTAAVGGDGKVEDKDKVARSTWVRMVRSHMFQDSST